MSNKTINILVTILLISTFKFSGFVAYHIHKLTICNKAMQLYLYHNQGIAIDMNFLYQDAVKWVNLPEYQIPKEKRK